MEQLRLSLQPLGARAHAGRLARRTPDTHWRTRSCRVHCIGRPCRASRIEISLPIPKSRTSPRKGASRSLTLLQSQLALARPRNSQRTPARRSTARLRNGSSRVRSNSGNRAWIVTAGRKILGLARKLPKGFGWVMPEGQADPPPRLRAATSAVAKPTAEIRTKRQIRLPPPSDDGWARPPGAQLAVRPPRKTNT